MEIPEGKHLGSLCKRGHDWNGTGYSLRYKGGSCYECMMITVIKYNKTYSESISKYNKKYKKEYYKKNIELIKEKRKIYCKVNSDKRKDYQRTYFKKRRKTDPKFRLNLNIRTEIYLSIIGNKNGHHWETLVGYTLEVLKLHFENLFTEGMTWQKYLDGKIHLDHIIPISAFNFDSPEHIDFKRCWALSNLQPLWAKDNLKKNNKLDVSFQPCLKL